jgi:glycosyltransferase involved in cell wall biosynthesis
MEGTPKSVLEALASGRRVIATAVGGVPDVITDDVFGELVPPHDTRALADALIRAVARPYEPAAVAAAAAIPSWDESAGVLHGALVQALGRR